MITTNNLCKNYGSLRAVDKVSLSIAPGELFGLLGPNGAGKSTLIGLLTGLLAADGGRVEFSGPTGSVSRAQAKRLIGIVPQELAFYPAFSAYENVSFFASLYGLRAKELKAASLRALEFVGLADVGKKAAKSFSGGMKRRLNIACGLAHDPSIIFLDEPTVGIDPQSRNHILRSVQELSRQGKTIVYTTHYMEEAEAICSRLAIMDKGKIIAEGSKDELKLLVKDASRVSFSLAKDQAVDLEGFKTIPGVMLADYQELSLSVTSQIGVANLNLLTAEINRQGLPLASMSCDNPSLETVFLSLTGRSLRD